MATDVDLVIPVYDEEATLEVSVRRIHDHLSAQFPFAWRITIADNASRDHTWAIAAGLTHEFDNLGAIHLPQKGRGRALRHDVARALLPFVEDEGWFFDTELLALAEHNGLRIHEVPVDWVDDADSRVDVRATAMQDLRGIWRVLRRFANGEGVVSDGSLPRRQRLRQAG